MERLRTAGDKVHRGLFNLTSLLSSEYHGKFLRACFEHKHRRPDPWKHEVAPYETAKYTTTLARIPPRPYRRIADIGCSEGTFTRRVADAYPTAEVVGVDISQRALERASRRASAQGLDNVTFTALNIFEDSPDGLFDLVFCSELLYYLGGQERLRTACSRIAALLAPQGLLVAVHPWPESRRLHRPFDSAQRLTQHSEHIETATHRPYAVTVYEHGDLP
ncbi:class I SAM-dependent methyltransferase [Streptomyces sp. NPDC057743]|uniref:class I SAM-dependent methyltransferase n=1 Tax=Streptomyces sp. NPDC057743 TaxID=3346236 RepID=UPI0036D14F79